jgi:hypothetical protein
MEYNVYMKLRIQPRPNTRRDVVTYYIAKLGDPVWVRVGIGWCAGTIIHVRRQYAVIKFTTGAREKTEWKTMRFRKGEQPPAA